MQKPSLTAEEMISNLLLNIKPTYTLAIPLNIKHMAVDGEVCFHRQPFADPIKPPNYATGSMELVSGISKDEWYHSTAKGLLAS